MIPHRDSIRRAPFWFQMFALGAFLGSVGNGFQGRYVAAAIGSLASAAWFALYRWWDR
jgi:hypothetical protein